MKRYLFLTLIIGATCASNAAAQNFFQKLEDGFRQQGQQFQQQGRQFFEQGIGGFQDSSRNTNPPQQQSFGGSLPSEGGNQSGGQDRVFNPNDGGFVLPGNGGQPFQPTPGFQNNNPYPNQYPGSGNTYDQYGNRIYPNGQTGNRIVSNRMPNSPVMSNQYVMIRCPQSTGGSVSYTLQSNGRNFNYTISPGQEQRFTLGSGWIVSFNSGSVQKRYKLEGGKIYSMKRDKQSQWEMYVAK